MAEHSSIESIHQTIQEIRKLADQDLSEAKTARHLEDFKVRFLGRKGPVQQLMKELRQLSEEIRPEAGRWINDLKEDLSLRCETRYATLVNFEETERLAQEKIDVSLPGRRRFSGRRHPLLSTVDEAVKILCEMGFTVQLSPDIETDYYNFESLNYPKDHPARDMQDTFYITPDLLLRTHNTCIQVRTMESNRPPIRIIHPGKCYRNEEITSRSHVFFFQIDGLYIDKGVTFGDLLATMNELYTKLLGPVKTRVRPSYFPFVEPGMEVDVHCIICKGRGCSVCKHTGWLEVAGAGMVHPEVLINGGIDPEVYSGYAWGMGLDRLVMLKHRIKDIRLFTENDMRFLEQFP